MVASRNSGDRALSKAFITAEQAQRLRALENVGEPPELPASPDDEQLRFIGGFSDVFVTLGAGDVSRRSRYFRAGSRQTRREHRDRRRGLVTR